MATFTERSLQCRTNRATRIFKSVYDTASVMNIPAEVDFISKKQYSSNTATFVLISECEDSALVNLWCPITNIQYIEINEEIKPVTDENDKSYDIESINKVMTITGNRVMVYNNRDSSSPITSGLKLNDTITCDKSFSFVNNGIDELRYHIIDTTSDDMSIIGKWIVVNYALTVMNKKTRVSNPRMIATTTVMSDTPAVVATPTIESLHDSNVSQLNTIEIDTTAESYGTTVTSGSMTIEDLHSYYAADFNNDSAFSLMDSPIGRMLFVHGMPFQYTGITDRRIRGSGVWSTDEPNPHKKLSNNSDVDAYGRSFAKEIASNLPIVVIAPGVPSFMSKVKDGLFGLSSGRSRKARQTFSGFFRSDSDEEVNNILEQLDLNSNGNFQYYSMTIDTEEYFKYVNALCRTSARLMGISDIVYRGVKCANFDWGKYNTAADQDYSTFEEVMGADAGVSFVYDPVSSVSDTINNSTGESRYSSMFDNLSSSAKEIQFITGMFGHDVADMLDNSGIENWSNKLNNNDTLIANAENVVKRTVNLLTNSAKGMNVRFPEIWQDSSYGKSYSVDMHFISPYATAFCKWRYVLVPFFHIFALAAPTSDPDNVNVYGRPFLIRAFSRGYFNVEMGIIDSITWKRYGDGDMISADGIPMQIDVSIDFKDMYKTLAMSHFGTGGGNVTGFFNNTGLMDFIGTLSGVNMNRINLAERIALYAESLQRGVRDIDDNIMRHFSDRFINFTNKYLLGI